MWMEGLALSLIERERERDAKEKRGREINYGAVYLVACSIYAGKGKGGFGGGYSICILCAYEWPR